MRLAGGVGHNRQVRACRWLAVLAIAANVSVPLVRAADLFGAPEPPKKQAVRRPRDLLFYRGRTHLVPTLPGIARAPGY